MSDVFQRLGRLVENLFENSQAGGHHDPDGEFEKAWRELDEGMKASWAGFRPDSTPFDDMDRSFAEFDRRFEDATGRKPEPGKASRTGGPGASAGEGHHGAGNQNRHNQDFRGKQTNMNDDELRKTASQLVQDYHNLEIKPGCSPEEVRNAYKRMMKTYHPDRFADNPEKQKIAHQVSVKINESYQRILKYLG